jgi:hypothetical protein
MDAKTVQEENLVMMDVLAYLGLWVNSFYFKYIID